MTETEQHQHQDVGGGYCACGAERCSLPGCDGWCVHPGGWIEAAELAELRRIDYRALAERVDPQPPDLDMLR